MIIVGKLIGYSMCWGNDGGCMGNCMWDEVVVV